MWCRKRERSTMCTGDPVVMWFGKDRQEVITLNPEEKYNYTFGVFPHLDLLGRDFGSRIYGKTGKGYTTTLRLTPELWTQSLSHRTQILYEADIAVILFNLELSDHCNVVEAGTGSGSLSHSLIRRILPHGHLYTYDFHQTRSVCAAQEFKQHGLEEYVTCGHRDVIQDGLPADLPPIDAVFFDLPDAAAAIPHAFNVLKAGGRICTFCPCIEQVQRVVHALEQYNFTRIQTIEVVLRKFDVISVDSGKVAKTNSCGKTVTRPNQEMKGHTGYLTFAYLTAQGKAKAPSTVEGTSTTTTSNNNNSNKVQAE